MVQQLCEDGEVTTPTSRVYAGQEAQARTADRRRKLMESALDLLADPDETLTVRSVCRHSGVVARYFYESFDDREALVDAVFDEVVAGIATSTLAVVAEIERDPLLRTRAAITNIVEIVAEDPRRGRLLFSPNLSEPRLLIRRTESAQLFANLLNEQARSQFRHGETDRLMLTSQFTVGGFGQTLFAWIHGGMEMSKERLIELCTAIFVRLATESP